MRRQGIGALVAGALALAGCGGATHGQVSRRTTVVGESFGPGPVVGPPTHAGPVTINITPPGLAQASPSRRRLFAAGRVVAAESGCLACHRIGADGNRGPGPDLTYVGDRLSQATIARALVETTPPMPSFRNLPHAKQRALVGFLSELRR